MSEYVELITAILGALALITGWIVWKYRRLLADRNQLASSFSSAQDSITELTAEIQELHEDREILEEDFSKKAQDLQSVNVENEESLRQAKASLERQEATILDLTQELEKCNRRLLEQEQKLAELEPLALEAEQWKASLEQSGQIHAQKQEELEQLQHTVQKLEAQVREKEHERSTHARLNEQHVLELQAALQRRDQKIHGLSEEVERLRDELAQNTGSTDEKDYLIAHWQNRYTKVSGDLNHYKEEAKKSYTSAVEWKDYADNRQHTVDQMTEELVRLKEDFQNQREAMRERNRKLAKHCDELEKQVEAKIGNPGDLRERIEHIEDSLEQRGRIWEKPLPQNAPPFHPLNKRKANIISVINLKGGVGKTTLTANLGALLAEKGASVLLVDLDYQRSLSKLFFSPLTHKKDLEVIEAKKRHVQHFFASDNPDEELFEECITSLDDTIPNLSIVACIDPKRIARSGKRQDIQELDLPLEDLEMHLLLDWLIQGREPDIRLLLRNVLHSPLLQDRFDYVLMDCPPRLSTGCVSALVASDFALIPVIPDRTSATDPVPNLLHKLGQLKDKDVLPHLNNVGVIANCVDYTGRGDTGWRTDQIDVWSDLPSYCEVVWKDRIRFFETYIKQTSDFSKARENLLNGKPRALGYQVGYLRGAFEDLIRELEKEIARERENHSEVSANLG